MTFQPNLVVPTVLWGQHAPTHCPSVVTISKDMKTIASGSLDGQVILWEMDPKTVKITPRLMLMGHNAPVLCFASASHGKDMSALISAAENGEMCLWDLQGGRCVEHTKSPNVHINFTGYYVTETNDYWLLANGYYPGVQVINPTTLQVLFTLTARISADWISALTVVKWAGKNEDVVVGVTTTGAIKTWTLTGSETANSEPYFETESRQLRCYNALKLVCCQYNPRVLLMVCSKFWQIYDTSDFSLLVSTTNPVGERFLSGEFLTTEKILMWTDSGRGYLYWLPSRSVAENRDFRTQKSGEDEAFLFCELMVKNDTAHYCPPRFVFAVMPERGQLQRYLIRADCAGRLAVWNVPEVSAKEISQMKQEPFASLPNVEPKSSLSLQEAFDRAFPSPPGILDQIERDPQHPNQRITCSLFIPSQGRLVCGTNDGQIVMVSATHTIMLHLLSGKHQGIDGWPVHQVFLGHAAKVTTLVYPHNQHSRYDPSHLVSGSADFCVYLWDLGTGALLYKFCVQGGEITQLIVPPPDCGTRILNCVCSVSSDHSVALLSLKERKCIMLASRHIFPVVTIKWRPAADYMVVACTDGSVSVWEMETTNLERVLEGTLAEDVLAACDDGVGTDASIGGGGSSSTGGGAEIGLANPAVHFFRGLRHRNVAAMRHAAQRGLDRLHGQSAQVQGSVDTNVMKNCVPLSIQGLRTNLGDSLSHVLFFHIEALIVSLMSEEYDKISPATLESQGLILRNEYLALDNLTVSTNLDTQLKLAGFLVRVKEGAESVQQKIQAKAESVGLTSAPAAESPVHGRKAPGPSLERATTSLASLGIQEEKRSFGMEVAQLLISLLHGWGLDPDLDRVCQAKLGLLRPMVPVSFGLLSRGGYMSLFLPTWFPPVVQPVEVAENLPLKEYEVLLAKKTEFFTARGRWELAPAITTHHLLTIVSVSNTLMSMSNATFLGEDQKRARLTKQMTLKDGEAINDNQVKQGWSLLTTLHCILLPDIVAGKYKRIRVEMLARRWQDRCLEVREGAQALLLAELNRIGPKGRKALVEAWAPFLPTFSEIVSSSSAHQAHGVGSQNPTAAYSHGAPQYHGHHGQMQSHGRSSLQINGPPLSQGDNRATSPIPPNGNVMPATEKNLKGGDNDSDSNSDEDEVIGDAGKKDLMSMAEMKRKQTTSIVLMGVIGAEFGQELEPIRKKEEVSLYPQANDGKQVQEGFGIAQALARQTTQALSYLLLAPPSPGLPPYSALRRSAVDLIGRGFPVWEPHLEVSKVLLGLLELCAADADKLAPSMEYGLPLTPVADMCRTSRHALLLVATARPQVFITTLAREVARYNTLQQNAQTLNVNLSASVLARAKADMLRVLSKLFETRQLEVVNLMVEVMDIVLHCIDTGHLRAKTLQEVFPTICRFPMVAHCLQTRRIAVGAQNGQLALYELKGSKCQSIPAHVAGITACAFAHDGKFLATYSQSEARLSFWQTSSGMFGLGNTQTKCVKSFSTAPVPEIVRLNPLRTARLVWINARTIALLMPDGSESRFSV